MIQKVSTDLDLEQLKSMQLELRNRVRIVPFEKDPKRVAGCDVSYNRKKNLMAGVVVVMAYPDLEVIEEALHIEKVTFPYIPTYLSFRELPVLLKAFRELREKPDLILVDGQGIAHPRRLGIASHLGISLELPTIGCAKSRLVGEFNEPDVKRGSFSLLNYEGRVVGAVLRTRDNTKPIFVSPGHLIDVASSVRLTLSLCTKYRLPEPIRYADRRSREVVNEKI